MLQCAKPIKSQAQRALPVSIMQLPTLRDAPLQCLERPALMLLRGGDIQIRDRNSLARRLPNSSIAFHPAMADYGGSTWSCEKGSRYTVLEMPEGICTDLLQRTPAWLHELRRPVRFLDPRVTWWIDEIENHCAAGEPNGAFYTEAVGIALLAYLDSLLRQDKGPAKTASLQPMSQRAVRQVKEYIEAHLAESLSIHGLAHACGYSPVHFARLFKQAFGMPVHQFILQSRIDSARLKLVSNSCSLAEIASECGFSSQAHFSSAFRRFVGTSPGDFRTARRR